MSFIVIIKTTNTPRVAFDNVLIKHVDGGIQNGHTLAVLHGNST